jgi:hypothetical protein
MSLHQTAVMWRGGIMRSMRFDQDMVKGATELDGHQTPGNFALQGQLGHRDQDSMLKDADTDFPEPGLNPEHSGEWEKKKG